MLLIRVIQYIVFVPFTLLLSLVAVVFAPKIAKYVDSDGNLPYRLRWFQPSDNPAWGDEYWARDNPSWSKYELAVGYIKRNPAQGFDQWVTAEVTEQTPFKVRGNLHIKDGDDGVAGYYLITANGYFHFAYILPIGFGKCMTGGFGWRLNSLALGYPHKTLGQLAFTPFRFYKFNNKM